MPRQGRHIPSPVKRRNPRKSAAYVRADHLESKRALLLAKLKGLSALKLEEKEQTSQCEDTLMAEQDDIESAENSMDVDNVDASQADLGAPTIVIPVVPQPASATSKAHPKVDLTTRWANLLPTLHVPYLSYTERSMSQPLSHNIHASSHCMTPCSPKVADVLCLFFDRMFSFSCQMWLTL